MAFTFNTTAIPLEDLPSPLAYLPSRQAHNILLATYVHLGTVAILVWDVINNLRNDWKLVSAIRHYIPTSVYLTTRISLMAYAVGRAILLTRPVKSCAKFQDALNSLLVVFVTSTTFLYYIRVCKLYAMDRGIMVVFGVLWLASVAMTATLSKTFTAERIQPTHYCLEEPAGGLLGPVLAVQLVNELSLYFAITRKVYALLVADAKAKDAVLPQAHSPRSTTLSAILHFATLEPQLYSFCIVATKAFLVCATYALNPPSNAMFLIVHFALTNIWSGRMYRTIMRTIRVRTSDPPMLSQMEFELRIGRSSVRNQPSHTCTGEQTQSNPAFVPIPDPDAKDKHVIDVNHAKRKSSTIYTVQRDLKFP